MIKQFQLTLIPDKKTNRNLGYFLYGALMEHIPHHLGEQCHKNGFTPIRQYLQRDGSVFLWNITLFGQAISALEPVLKEGTVWRVRRENLSLRCVSVGCSPVLEAEDFFQMSHSQYSLQFHTATAFKQKKQYQNMPSSHLIFQNLSRKWNDAFPTARIEDQDGEGIEAIAQGVYYKNFSLHQEKYVLKEQIISAFVGELEFGFRLSGFHLTLCQVLLEFAHYSGVGIKTSLGMGGCSLKKEIKS